ncbi:hypothetical protein [Qipengyuania nanhaisediminis]|nr:hypothetical protein [Qipengyuania nanhaisediminis]
MMHAGWVLYPTQKMPMMPQYVLEFDDDDLGQPKRVEFGAENPAAALPLLKGENKFRQVKLWEGDRLLGELMRDGRGVWHLNDDPI